jgi:hypothetical protein
MVRIFVVAFALCLAGFTQAQTRPVVASTATGTATTGPAIAKPAQKDRALKNPHGSAGSGHCQLGIIPIVGFWFQVQKIGFGIFGNEYTRVRVDSWSFDDLVTARVRAAAPDKTARRVLFAPEELARHKQTGAFRNINAELKQFVRDVSAGVGCDRYVLVHLDDSQVIDSPELAHGMGIINVGTLIKRRTYLFALTYVRIYDGKSFDIVKQGAASIGDEPPMSFALRQTPFRGPKRELDEASFPAIPAQAATNPTFREGVRALLTASLDKTLPALLGK